MPLHWNRFYCHECHQLSDHLWRVEEPENEAGNHYCWNCWTGVEDTLHSNTDWWPRSTYVDNRPLLYCNERLTFPNEIKQA